MGGKTETDKYVPRVTASAPVLKQVFPCEAASASRSWLVGEELVIGREANPDQGICLPDDSKVSKQHAVLRHNDDGVELSDLCSKNHTYVDGRQISTEMLNDGSIVRVGTSLFVLRIERIGIGDAPKSSRALHERIRGQSAEVCELRHQLNLAARAADPILLIGPTGTGKELAAEAVHALSSRSAKPLISVNCAALPPGTVESALFGHKRGAFTSADQNHEGFFKQADGGTLFLDEIGELPPDLQAKLLRVLQPPSSAQMGASAQHLLRFRPLGSRGDVEVDVRIIAATHVDLTQAISNGRFRSDLYQRLCVLPVRFPALVDHPEDILWLLHHYLNIGLPDSDRRSVGARLAEQLLLYSWPGNVRELVNVSKRLRAFFPSEKNLDLDSLPVEFVRHFETNRRSAPAPATADTTGNAAEPLTAELLTRLLQEKQGVIAKVAAALGRSPRQIRRRMEQFKIRVTGADSDKKSAT